MKVHRLASNPLLYAANSYLILGDWNKLDDVNTLIDPGPDDYILAELSLINTGVGKKPVEQVILTHNHFDHAAGLHDIIRAFQPHVLAVAPGPGVTQTVHRALPLVCGDAPCELIPLPGHSDDSLVIYCPAQRLLFSGDTPLTMGPQATGYSSAFLDAWHSLIRRPIDTVYPGHGSEYSGIDGSLR